ncbi:MAG: ArsR/SmtB family transcription factor [Bacillota bacterium]
MLKDEEFFDLADFFKVFGDSTRIKIIFVLLKSEMCVCDIASTLDMSQSAISHQLRVLRNNRLVKYRKEGKTVYYSLDDAHVEKIFDQGYEHLNHK